MVRARSQERSAAAAVEFALILPFLAFLFVAAIDFGRVFYASLTVTNCARNGALYAYDPYSKLNSRYSSLTEAALADASNLTPPPTVTSATGSDANGTYLQVTVTYQFNTVTNFPGVPSTTTISRTVRMNTAPRIPKP